MARLYLTIQLQGVDWDLKRSEEEQAYEELTRAIIKAIARDQRFVGPTKSVNIQIGGYEPIVKSMLVTWP